MQRIRNCNQHGFTLIEIIGVLAIMSIMAATIAPSAIQMITSSKQTSEDKALAAISDALRLYVQTNKKVPAEAAGNAITAVGTATNVEAWDKAIATIMNVAANKVSTNTINKKRIYLYPADFIAASAPNPLPYDQKAELTNINAGNGMLVTTAPDPRMMVISNMNPGVTLNTTSGSKAVDLFNAIWNQATVNGTAVPAELTEGDKLKIARINMTDLFPAVNFNQQDSTYNTAIQIDTLPTTPYKMAKSSSPFTAYLIKGSQISFYDGFTTGNGSTIYSQQIVQNSNSMYFSGNIWGSSPGASGGSGAGGGTGGNGSGVAGAITTLFSSTTGKMNNSALKPKSNCAVQASGGLTIDGTNASDDYFVYEGDANGDIITWDQAKKGEVTYFGKTKPNNYKINGRSIKKQRKNGKDKNGNKVNDIQTCHIVIAVPATNNAGASFYMFYMPATQTASPFEITLP